MTTDIQTGIAKPAGSAAGDGNGGGAGGTPAGAGAKPSASKPAGAPAAGTSGDDGLGALIGDPRLLHAARRSKFSADTLGRFGDEERLAFLQQVADSHDEISTRMGQLGAGKPAGKTGEGAGAAGDGTGDGGQPPEIPYSMTHNPEELLNAGASTEWVEERGRFVESINGLAGELHSAQEALYVMQAEFFFQGLGEEYRSLVGSGMTNIHSQEPHQQFRLNVLSQASQILAGAQLRGVPMTIQEALDASLSVVAKDKLAALTRERLEKEAADRSGQRTGAPGTRHSAPLTEDERKGKALGAIHAVRKRHGLA